MTIYGSPSFLGKENSEASESLLGMTIYGNTSSFGKENSGASERSLGKTIYGSPIFLGKENSEASESPLEPIILNNLQLCTACAILTRDHYIDSKRLLTLC